MKVKCLLVIEDSRRSILIQRVGDSIQLPNFEVRDRMLLKDQATTFLLSLGIGDATESDLTLFSLEESIEDNKHTIYLAYKTQTRNKDYKMLKDTNYKFVSLKDLKNEADKFICKEEGIIARLYILNPYATL